MKIEIEVPDSFIASALSSATDSGGVNHWCKSCKWEGRKGKVSGWAENNPTIEYLFRPIQLGRLKLYPHERSDLILKEYVVDQNRLRQALKLMVKDFPHHFANLMCANSDMITGDVLVQLACFGEIVFE